MEILKALTHDLCSRGYPATYIGPINLRTGLNEATHAVMIQTLHKTVNIFSNGNNPHIVFISKIQFDLNEPDSLDRIDNAIDAIVTQEQFWDEDD